MRKDLAGLINNFRSFREANDSFEKKLMNSKTKKLKSYLEKVPKLESQFNSLAGSNFKVLEVKIKKLNFKIFNLIFYFIYRNLKRTLYLAWTKK